MPPFVLDVRTNLEFVHQYDNSEACKNLKPRGWQTVPELHVCLTENFSQSNAFWQQKSNDTLLFNSCSISKLGAAILYTVIGHPAHFMGWKLWTLQTEERLPWTRAVLSQARFPLPEGALAQGHSRVYSLNLWATELSFSCSGTHQSFVKNCPRRKGTSLTLSTFWQGGILWRRVTSAQC